MAQPRPQRQPTPPAIAGGPGVEPDELPPEESTGPETTPPPAERTGTSVKIGGREFTVEPELAAALEGREQEFNRKLGEQGRELGDHRAWRREVESRLPPKVQPQGYDYDTKLFEDPRGALGRFKEEIIEEVRTQYQGDQAQRNHWDRFYKAHPDLADEERLVRVVSQDLIQNGWGSRGPEDIPQFMDELAKQTRGELLRISRKTREADTPSERLPRGRTPIEGGGGNRRTPAPVEPDEPITLVGEIQRRQRARSRRAIAE